MFANLGGNMEWAFWGRWWGREDWQEECQSRQGFHHHHLNQQRPSKRMSRFFYNHYNAQDGDNDHYDNMPMAMMMKIRTQHVAEKKKKWWRLLFHFLKKNARPGSADERWQQYFQETKTRRQRPGPPTLFHPLGHFCPGERYFTISSLIFFSFFLNLLSYLFFNRG